MPKQPVSVTLDVDNLLWLRGLVSSRKRRSLSDALDEVITAARTGGAGEVRSVVGTVTIPSDDPYLGKAKAHVRALFEESLSRPLLVRERPVKYAASTKSKGRRQPRKKAQG